MGETGKTSVLLTGPTSYLGRRLMLQLLDRRDIRLRTLVVDRRSLGEAAGAVAEVVEGNLLDVEVLRKATEGIDVAYFPVRFLGTDPEFDRQRKIFARMYRDACIQAGVRRIVFLGVLTREHAEDESVNAMIEIGEILSACPDRIQTIWLRAGFIVGSGSMLFEVLKNLTQKMPFLPTPRWMETRVSVIGARDIKEYLVQAIDLPPGRSVEVEIGLEPRSIREMLAATARVMGLSRVFIPLPVTARRLSPTVLMLLTPFSTRLASMFIHMLATAGKTHGAISQEGARRHFPGISPAPFEVAVARAIEAIEQEEVISRWTDSIARVTRTDAEEEISRSVFRDVREENFGGIAPEKIFRAVKSIGGEHGWFTYNLLWQIRGLIDKLFGGYGISVGRRAESDLRVGDVLDVWKVIDLKESRRLLLEAQMKVGGKAWLEFRIEGNTLVQTAYHFPKGLMGRLYWYSMVPFHAFIFRDMIRSIIRQAGGGGDASRGPHNSTRMPLKSIWMI